MKLTIRQREALIAARDHGTPFAPNGSILGARANAGGAYRRMVERLTDSGLLDRNWVITEAGRTALKEQSQ